MGRPYAEYAAANLATPKAMSVAVMTQPNGLRGWRQVTRPHVAASVRSPSKPAAAHSVVESSGLTPARGLIPGLTRSAKANAPVATARTPIEAPTTMPAAGDQARSADMAFMVAIVVGPCRQRRSSAGRARFRRDGWRTA